MSYLFGDSARAQRRLDILARTFDAPTREFLANFEPSSTDLALDLGCGPGHTTRLIADLLPFDKIVGLDKSSQFVSFALRSSPSRVSFINHDVTVVPFPIPSADLIFCRFLLPHLPNPIRALVGWVSQLSTEGALLVEEVDWIHTDNPVLELLSHHSGPSPGRPGHGPMCRGPAYKPARRGTPQNRLGQHSPPLRV